MSAAACAACVGSSRKARRAERGTGELAVGNGAVALAAQPPDGGDGRSYGNRHQDCRRRAAVGVDVRATVVAIRLMVRIAGFVGGDLRGLVVVVGAAESVIQVRVDERVRLGKLRRMQNRQLAPAEQRYGEKYSHHQFFDQFLHSTPRRPASAPFVKCGTVGESFPSVI